MEIPKQIDTNEKKAWFMVGYLYNLAVKNKEVRGSCVSEENEAFKFQKIKANNESFYKFANEFSKECWHKHEYDGLFSEMANYHMRSEHQLSNDEAKYYFSWGASV